MDIGYPAAARSVFELGAEMADGEATRVAPLELIRQRRFEAMQQLF
jgi:hypothetical protein